MPGHGSRTSNSVTLSQSQAEQHVGDEVSAQFGDQLDPLQASDADATSVNIGRRSCALCNGR